MQGQTVAVSLKSPVTKYSGLQHVYHNPSLWQEQVYHFLDWAWVQIAIINYQE